MPTYPHLVPAPLSACVASCTGYDHRPHPASVHHGLPSTTLTVVLAFDEPLDCGWPDGQARGRFDSLVAGLHASPSLIHTHGRQHGIQLALTPLGARTLLGAPAASLAGEIVDGDVAGLVPRSLHRRLQDAGWRDRFRILDEHLLGRLDPRQGGPRPEVIRAFTRLQAAHGRLRVDDLAREVGYSRRHLLTTFRVEFGVSPSQVARVARFEFARGLLRAGRPLAEIAVLAGFADQPHLNREWRALAATTPTRSLEEFPIVQDGAV